MSECVCARNSQSSNKTQISRSRETSSLQAQLHVGRIWTGTLPLALKSELHFAGAEILN